MNEKDYLLPSRSKGDWRRNFSYDWTEIRRHGGRRGQKHRRIENNLHWMLDVVFHEDDAHVRLGHAAVILNMFRKLCLQLLKSDTSVKGSIQSKRLRCAWDFNFALSVILRLDASCS